MVFGAVGYEMKYMDIGRWSRGSCFVGVGPAVCSERGV
jgi:hypothetical protein